MLVLVQRPAYHRRRAVGFRWIALVIGTASPCVMIASSVILNATPDISNVLAEGKDLSHEERFREP